MASKSLGERLVFGTTLPREIDGNESVRFLRHLQNIFSDSLVSTSEEPSQGVMEVRIYRGKPERNSQLVAEILQILASALIETIGIAATFNQKSFSMKD
ncbi:hypothetical protein KA017_02025 [Candidatus Woesebacteria bacterium]|nr:hypothetical protein [Candidatus Woesebacteria bacterium]